MRIQCPRCHGTRRVSYGEVCFTELTSECSYCDSDGMIEEAKHHIEQRVELAQRVQAVMRDQTAGDAYDVFTILIAGAARQLELSPEKVFADLQATIGTANRLKKNELFACESCRATFVHHDVDECPTRKGECAHLHDAGWRSVHVRIMSPPEKWDGRRRTVLFARGGWICKACREKNSHLMNVLP